MKLRQRTLIPWAARLHVYKGEGQFKKSSQKSNCSDGKVYSGTSWKWEKLEPWFQMAEEGTALILEGGKDTIPKSVPLREPILAGVIQQSDQEIFPFFAHEMIFSHAQNNVGFFRSSRESCSNWSTLLPVLWKKCNTFCQQIKRSSSEVHLHSWTALIQTRPMYFVFFEHLTEARIKEKTKGRHIFVFAYNFSSAGFSADQDDFIQSSPSAGLDW